MTELDLAIQKLEGLAAHFGRTTWAGDSLSTLAEVEDLLPLLRVLLEADRGVCARHAKAMREKEAAAELVRSRAPMEMSSEQAERLTRYRAEEALQPIPMMRP